MPFRTAPFICFIVGMVFFGVVHPALSATSDEKAPELGGSAKIVKAINVASSQIAKVASDRLRGRILLQVENNGEAWYVRPDVGTRVFMGRPADAFLLMRTLGIGITNTDLEKIPLALANLDGSPDSDVDGLSDMAETALGTDSQNSDTDGDAVLDGIEVKSGYDPLRGNGVKYPTDTSFAKKHVGKIFLAAQRNGEAWYIHPTELKRYYLGRPHHAFEIMRRTGLGISNVDLTAIAESDFLMNLAEIALASSRAKVRDAKRLSDVRIASTAMLIFYTDFAHFPSVQEVVALGRGNAEVLTKNGFEKAPGSGDIYQRFYDDPRAAEGFSYRYTCIDPSCSKYHIVFQLEKGTDFFPDAGRYVMDETGWIALEKSGEVDSFKDSVEKTKGE